MLAISSGNFKNQHERECLFVISEVESLCWEGVHGRALRREMWKS